MTLRMDPAGNEISALQKATTWDAKQVLEIGCGEGRLTLRLAALGAGRIEAIDPAASAIRQARASLPARYRKRVTYHVGHAEALRHPPGAFDIVLLSWVL